MQHQAGPSPPAQPPLSQLTPASARVAQSPPPAAAPSAAATLRAACPSGQTINLGTLFPLYYDQGSIKCPDNAEICATHGCTDCDISYGSCYKGRCQCKAQWWAAALRSLLHCTWLCGRCNLLDGARGCQSRAWMERGPPAPGPGPSALQAQPAQSHLPPRRHGSDCRTSILNVATFDAPSPPPRPPRCGPPRSRHACDDKHRTPSVRPSCYRQMCCPARLLSRS